MRNVVLILALLLVPGLTAQKKNVLFIIADDLNNDLGAYGHPVVKSPHFDALAERGVRFNRAYCQYPQCGPSRVSLMAGLYPDQTGVLANRTPMRRKIPDVVSLSQHFRNNGYFAARVGKIYHFGVPGDIGTDSVDDPPSWAEVRNPIGRDRWAEHLIYSISPKRDMGGTLSWWPADGNGDEQTDSIGAGQMVELLEEHKDEPFFLAMGFYRPHTPYVAPRQWFDRYPLSAIRLPFVPADDREDMPGPAWMDRMWQAEMTERTKLRAMRGYYSAISYMDEQLGKVVAALDRLGLADNTIITMTSDHGYHMGEHHLWQKTSLFENSARVPLVVVDPSKRGTAGQVTDAVVELVDLYPTLADLAGLPAPAHTVGQSFAPALEDVSWAGKDAALTVHIAHDRVPHDDWEFPKCKAYSIRTARYRYTEYQNGELGVELYDHQADPGEFSNLADDPRHRSLRNRMSDLLETVLAKATAEPRL